MNGKKTYAAGVATVLSMLWLGVSGEIDWTIAGPAIAVSLQAMGLRHAIARGPGAGAGVVLLLLALPLLAAPATAQLSVDPNSGGVVVVKDGETQTVGEVLADIGYAFPRGDAMQELCGLYGLTTEGTTLGGLGFRHVFSRMGPSVGLGAQAFIVEGGTLPGVNKTSITLAPELLFRMPWVTQPTSGAGGRTVAQEQDLSAYVAPYFPVTGDRNFVMVRFGMRLGL